MSRFLGYSAGALGGHAREEVDRLLDAAENFSAQYDLDADEVLGEIAKVLNRRVEFARLRKRFGVTLPTQ
ncbi:hypothetical protein [Devosia sp. LjRoot3]|uniref:hypothetical protein n=1 Tax=Devosia sp. LjRoot3 TaxID=3342319 RepID=UPI003ECE4CA4